MTTLTETEMRTLAEATLHFCRVCLTETRGLSPMIHLLPENMVLTCPGEIMNNAESKHAFYDYVAAHARATGATAAILINDIWYLDGATNEEIETARNAAGRWMTVSEMAGMGIGRKAEAIHVTVDTPIAIFIMRQSYVRLSDRIEFGTIEELSTFQGADAAGACMVFHRDTPKFGVPAEKGKVQ